MYPNSIESLSASQCFVCWLLNVSATGYCISGTESAGTIVSAATMIEVADPTFYLTQSQYTHTGPTSPSTEPITPGAWQGSHWSANGLSHWYDSTPEKSRRQRDSNRGSSALEADALRADTVVETKLTFKVVKTTGHCNKVYGKFLIVLFFLVTTTSTDTLASTGTLNLQPLSNKSLVN